MFRLVVVSVSSKFCLVPDGRGCSSACGLCLVLLYVQHVCNCMYILVISEVELSVCYGKSPCAECVLLYVCWLLLCQLSHGYIYCRFVSCYRAFPPFLALGSGFAYQPYIDSPQSLWPGFESRSGHMTALPFFALFWSFFGAHVGAISIYGKAKFYLITIRRVFVSCVVSMFAL